MILEWSPQYELGVSRMDATHQEFVDCVNALHGATDDQMLAAMDALLAHTISHFEQENRWMELLAFPPAHCHVLEHDGILQITREVRGMIVEGGLGFSPDGIIVLGTSGSSMMSTSACVLAGTPPKTSAGLPASGVSQVNFEGMFPPALKAGLEMVSVCAEAALLNATPRSAAIAKCLICISRR